ncbi:MAG: hypothetical protein P4L99_25195 [Chthoniobacter sp.]|nr:hypothetical protein [Chthoniobacter sp.]
MRDIIHRHNLLNGIVFSVVEFGLIALLAGAYATYYLLHNRIAMGVVAGGIALNCAPVVVDGLREVRKRRAGGEAVGSFWDKAARKRHQKENPHMLRDAIALTVGTLLPFISLAAVLLDFPGSSNLTARR